MASRNRTSSLGKSIALLSAVGLVVVLTVNAFTVWPAAMLLRPAMSSVSRSPVGPFSSNLERVKSYDPVKIHVPNEPDCRLEVYAPTSSPSHRMPLIFWIHGGGFIGGSPAQVRAYGQILASQGFVVVSLEYALAPKYQYPTPIVQANAALAYLRANAGKYDADSNCIFLAGDSAGAQIASQLAAIYTSPDLREAMGIAPSLSRGNIRGVILDCGLYDMQTVGSTGFPFLRTFLWSYTGERRWMRFARIDELSTTHHITDAYPPTYLTVGNDDPFQSQSRELGLVLAAHHVEIRTRYWVGSKQRLSHEYQFALNTGPAQLVMRDVVSFIRENAG